MQYAELHPYYSTCMRTRFIVGLTQSNFLCILCLYDLCHCVCVWERESRYWGACTLLCPSDACQKHTLPWKKSDSSAGSYVITNEGLHNNHNRWRLQQMTLCSVSSWLVPLLPHVAGGMHIDVCWVLHISRSTHLYYQFMYFLKCV